MKTKKRMSLHKKIIIIASSVIAVVLVAFSSICLYINNVLDKVNYSDGTKQVAHIANDNITTSSNSTISAIEQAQKRIEQNLRDNSIPLAYDNNVYNVLLIGTDNRADVGGSRSDTMIILSINKRTDKIVITSLMRDIYLSIPGHGYDRLNAAYAYGGAQLLLQTVQDNFKIRIDKYIAVDFFSFIDIIDKLGGIKISVTQEELPVLNDYIHEINHLKGRPADDGILKQSGSDMLLTGTQALGYSRIRYVGNADYQRTERQRTVLTQVFSKLKGQNIFMLNDVFNMLLPDITTNLEKGEFYSLILCSPAYSTYTIEQDRIPIDGSHTGIIVNHMDVLSIDFAKNIKEMQTRIYG